MAFSQELCLRVRAVLGDVDGLKEKLMFGGVGWLVRGNMACGIMKDDLIVRVGTEKYQEPLSRPHVKMFNMTGRPMSGWVMVEPPGFASQADLDRWVQMGLAVALALPPK